MNVNQKRVEAHEKKELVRRELQIRARILKEQGYSNSAIAKALGVSEGTLRNILKKEEKDNG